MFMAQNLSSAVRRSRRPQVLAAWVFLALLLLLAGIVSYMHQVQQDYEAERFEEVVGETNDLLSARIRSYEHGLRGTRSAILAAGPDRINLVLFRTLSRSRDPAVEFPGARGFGFIRRVRPEDEAAFLKSVATEGRQDFRIKQLAPHMGERFVIQYIEPEENNREAVGLDIGSETNRREAILTAFRSGKATLTHPITLVQASGKPKRGFLLLLPVYPEHEVPATNHARERAAIGATYSPLVIDEVLADLDLRQRGLSIRLYDLVDGKVPDMFYSADEQQSAARNALLAGRRISVFGREWHAEYHAMPAFVAQLNLLNTVYVGIGGLLLALLITFVIFREALVRERSKPLNAVLDSEFVDRIRELDAIRRQLRSALDVIPVMVGYWDKNGVNRVVNLAYGEWFGMDPAGLPGKHIRELLGEALYQQNLPYIGKVLSGETQTFEHAFPRPDGNGVRHCVVQCLPEFSAGEVHGVFVVVTDVTELAECRQRLSAALRETKFLLRGITEHLIYLVVAAQGQIIEVNDNCCRMSGYRRAELQGKHYDVLGFRTHDSDAWGTVWADLQAGKTWRGDICAQSQTGTEFWLDAVVAPVIGEGGCVERIIFLCYDITARKQCEMTLIEAEEPGNRAN